MTAADPAVGAPERLHPLFLLTGLGGALRGMAGGYAFIAYLVVSGRTGTALLAAGALFAMTAIGLFLYWRRFEFRIGDNEIRIDSGILNRTHRSIPFDRIQDVAIAQGPVARLLGLAKVGFETGGSASGSKEDGALQAIPLERAQCIRELVRARRSAARPGLDGADEEAEPVFAMAPRRLLLAGLFNFSLAIFAGLFGVSQTVGEVAGFDPFSRSFWESLVSRSDPLLQLLVAHRIAASLAGLVLLILIGFATGLARTVLRDFGFRLDRTGSGIRRRRGLLTRSDVTLPTARAQAAILATGPVRERFGFHALNLQSLARDEGGKGDHALAPLATLDEAGTVLESLDWRPVGPAAWTRVSFAYVGIAIAIAALPAAAAAGVAIWSPVRGLPILAVIAALVALRYGAWRRTGYALDGDRLLVRTGWWRRRLLILPLKRIQSIDLSHSALSRRLGIATLTFGVAGGSGLSAHRIPAVPIEGAHALRAHLLGPAA